MVPSSKIRVNDPVEPAVTLDLALKHGLEREEYDRVISILGRTPTYTELGIYSVMWSEHCSYKNSIMELKTLPRTGSRLLVGAGEENAGLVDIGNGFAVAFKIESHNHPSAVEPYQGAATGVGGIMRDIFTMGARPIAGLNSLRFGDPKNRRVRYLIRGIVRGIGDYGNSFGVPTVAGDVFFDECFNENPLVNAMAVGIVRHEEFIRAIASGIGNLVLIVGSSTGRDGIHGATFASEEISEESDLKRPLVQNETPSTEKLLLEATLEAIRGGLIIGLQDMGAAGITCSTSEMSAKGGVGMTIDIAMVPKREEGMTPYEVMLSESQERMLVIVTPANERKIRDIFQKWDLECAVIGTVTSDCRLKVGSNGKVVADIPVDSLVLGGGAPVYRPVSKEPDYIATIRKMRPDSLPEPTDYNSCLRTLLKSPNIASKRWIYRQYDSTVRTDTLLSGTGDAAVMRIKGTRTGLALKTDCNPRYVYLNPYLGAQIAVAESARNVVCVGAKPLAITNCLNFGNPKKPEMFCQFKEAVRGIGDACRALGTPVTGGNVSFYNESPAGPIFPTPVIGMLGELEDLGYLLLPGFKQAGDVILILGHTRGHLGGSEYLKVIQNRVEGDSPPLDLIEEKNLQRAALALIRKRLVHSAHDVSDGGLAISLAECCMDSIGGARILGARVNLQSPLPAHLALFGEDQSRIIISLPEKFLGEVQAILDTHNVPWLEIGNVGSADLIINDVVNISVAEIASTDRGAIEEGMGGETALV